MWQTARSQRLKSVLELSCPRSVAALLACLPLRSSSRIVWLVGFPSMSPHHPSPYPYARSVLACCAEFRAAHPGTNLPRRELKRYHRQRPLKGDPPRHRFNSFAAATGFEKPLPLRTCVRTKKKTQQTSRLSLSRGPSQPCHLTRGALVSPSLSLQAMSQAVDSRAS